MVTKVHKPIEAKANEKTVSESNLIRSSRQDQLKLNAHFRKAHQKFRSEVEDIEHRLKVNLPEFQSYKRTLLQESEPDYCYILEVWIEIVPYAMLGEFGVTHTRKVHTIREPFLARTGSDVEANGVLGLTQQELENLASWSAGRRNSLMNPASHLGIPSKVQALAWYCRLLALREFLQRLDLRMEKQSGEQQARRSPQSSGAGAATWDTIEISFLSDERIQIYNGTDTKPYNYAEFGFADSRNGKPNQAWLTLRDLAENRGMLKFAERGIVLWPKVEKRIQEIRKALRNRFGITSDPFLFKEGIGYQARFKIGLSPSFHT